MLGAMSTLRIVQLHRVGLQPLGDPSNTSQDAVTVVVDDFTVPRKPWQTASQLKFY